MPKVKVFRVYESYDSYDEKTLAVIGEGLEKAGKIKVVK